MEEIVDPRAAATEVRLFELDESKPRDCLQEGPGFLPYPLAVGEMAGIMVKWW